MTTLLAVLFWVWVAELVIRVGIIAGSDWPRERKQPLGEFVASTMIQMAFMAWIAILLWVRP